MSRIATSENAGMHDFTGDSSQNSQVERCGLLEAAHVLAGCARAVDLAGPEADVEHIELRAAAVRASDVLLDVLGLQELRGDGRRHRTERSGAAEHLPRRGCEAKGLREPAGKRCAP